jgi:hypothetical protein
MNQVIPRIQLDIGETQGRYLSIKGRSSLCQR